jgi:hypothetical protein
MDGCDDPVDEVIDNGVKETKNAKGNYIDDVKEVIKEGVRTSHPRQYVGEEMIDRVIDKGIIETHDVDWTVPKKVIDDVLENGIVSTHDDVYHHKGRIDGVIKNGVKEVISYDEYKSGPVNQFGYIDDIIDTGVKITSHLYEWVNCPNIVGEIIDNGVKETKTPGDCDLVSTIEWMNENNTSNVPIMIDDVIENGVKETVAAGYTDPKTNLLYIKWGPQIDEVIENGVKETNAGKRDWTITTNDVIESGVKETKSIGKESPNYPKPIINHIIKNGKKINGTYAGGQRQSEKCKSVVKYGTKNPTD